MTRQIPLQPQVPNGTCGFCMPGGCPPLRRRSRGGLPAYLLHPAHKVVPEVMAS